MVKKQSKDPSWHLIDAEGQVLGRISTKIATLLMGKHKAEFVRYQNRGDQVVVINAAKIHVTGKKLLQKNYYSHSGYPGGLKTIPLVKMLAEKPEEVMRHAVKGMLPHNRMGSMLLKRLHVYPGPSHSHTNLKPNTKEDDDRAS